MNENPAVIHVINLQPPWFSTEFTKLYIILEVPVREFIAIFGNFASPLVIPISG